MVGLLFLIGAVLFVAVYGFPLPCYIVQCWTGCNEDKAADDVYDLVSKFVKGTANGLIWDDGRIYEL